MIHLLNADVLDCIFGYLKYVDVTFIPQHILTKIEQQLGEEVTDIFEYYNDNLDFIDRYTSSHSLNKKIVYPRIVEYFCTKLLESENSEEFDMVYKDSTLSQSITDKIPLNTKLCRNTQKFISGDRVLKRMVKEGLVSDSHDEWTDCLRVHFHNLFSGDPTLLDIYISRDIFMKMKKVQPTTSVTLSPQYSLVSRKYVGYKLVESVLPIIPNKDSFDVVLPLLISSTEEKGRFIDFIEGREVD